MNNINTKTVVITGVGSGIGKALALNFAKAGCKLAINDFDQESLLATAKEAKEVGAADIFVKAFDVAKWEEMQDFASDVEKHYGAADIMINNAGVALGAYSVQSVTIPDFEWLMGINFWGMVYGTKAFLPLLIKSKEASIVNISSILGIGGLGNQAPYCASKFGIRGFTESLRMEAMIDFPHVNVISVHPGGIQTNIAKSARMDQSNYTEEQKAAKAKEIEEAFINTPDYAANTIINGIKSKKQKVLIGKDAKWMNFLIKWFPVGYTKMFIKRYGSKITED